MRVYLNNNKPIFLSCVPTKGGTDHAIALRGYMFEGKENYYSKENFKENKGFSIKFYSGISILTLNFLFSFVHLKEPLYFSMTDDTFSKPNPCKVVLLFVVDGNNVKLELVRIEGFVIFINKK